MVTHTNPATSAMQTHSRQKKSLISIINWKRMLWIHVFGIVGGFAVEGIVGHRWNNYAGAAVGLVIGFFLSLTVELVIDGLGEKNDMVTHTNPATSAMQTHSRQKKSLISIINWKRMLWIHVFGIVGGFTVEGIVGHRWDNYAGAVVGLVIGFFLSLTVELVIALNERTQELANLLERGGQITAESEDVINRLAVAALRPEIVTAMLNDSPYTGVLGSLYALSGGKDEIKGLDKKSYLHLLQQAILQGTETYLTIQPSGIRWFKAEKGFLEAFSESSLKECVRILLVDDEETIRAEVNDKPLLADYWNSVGKNTRTYWVTREALAKAESQSDRHPRKDVPQTSIQDISSDVVVCRGPQWSLYFRYEEKRQDGPRLVFWHQKEGRELPYLWVFALLERQLKDDEAGPFNLLPHSPFEGEVHQLRLRETKSVKIDLHKVRHNVDVLRRMLRRTGRNDIKITAVVKTDAYGVGLREVARCLLQCDIRSFGVGSIVEAIKLRHLDRKCEILLMEGIGLLDVPAAVTNDIECFVWNEDIVVALNEEARLQCKKANVHIKVDTGMHRLGVSTENFRAFLTALTRFDSIRVVGIASHLGDGEHVESERTRRQAREFRRCVDEAVLQLGATFCAHLANSASALRSVDLRYDAVRIGGSLLGIQTLADNYPDFEGLSLEECVTVVGRVMQVQRAPSHEVVSYGPASPDHTGGVPRTLAVINLGYGDGVPLAYAEKKAFVLIQGEECPVVGTICINMTVVDATLVEGIAEGHEAVFVGCSGRTRISAERAARMSGSHPYKIIHDFGTMLPRRYDGIVVRDSDTVLGDAGEFTL